jgi:hypothetical protein
LAHAAIPNVPFVEALYLKKASRRGRMLTLGGKLLDFAEKAAAHRQNRCERRERGDALRFSSWPPGI